MQKNLKHIIGLLAGLLCFVIYVLTLNPAVTFMDSGELAAACYTFGVPHPTGYPLFLLIGYITSHLPLGGSIIYRLNLLSAIESAAAVIVSYYSALIMIRFVVGVFIHQPVKKQQNKKDNKPKANEETPKTKRDISDYALLTYILSFAAAVCIGFGRTFWSDATQIEVYALHSLFMSILIYYALKILITLKEPVKKNWLMFFLFLGFSFSNHLTTIFIVPGLVYLFYLQYSSDKLFAKKVIPLALFVIPGILLYAVLVIASSGGPYLNWSDLQNISNLPGHLRGSDYSQLMFSSSSKFSANAGDFFKNLPGELAIIPLIFTFAGIVLLWKTFRNFVIFIVICVVFTLLYAFNYNIVDINTYYLLVFYLFVLIIPAGILYIISFGNPALIVTGKDEPKSSLIKAVVVSLILVVFSAGYNYKENNSSSNYANVDFTLNTLEALPNNSVLISYEWAYLYSSSLYYQRAEKIRPDVKVFNIKFLAAPWYLGSMSRYYPDVYENIKTEAEDYIRSYSNDEKQAAVKLTALVRAFIEKCSVKFPFYVTIDVILSKEMKQFFANNSLKPSGTVYRVEPKNSVFDPDAGSNMLNSVYRKFEPDNKQKSSMYNVIPGMYFETAYYHYNNKNFDLSLKLLDKALEFNPGFKDAQNLKSKITAERK